MTHFSEKGKKSNPTDADRLQGDNYVRPTQPHLFLLTTNHSNSISAPDSAQSSPQTFSSRKLGRQGVIMFRNVDTVAPSADATLRYIHHIQHSRHSRGNQIDQIESEKKGENRRTK